MNTIVLGLFTGIHLLCLIAIFVILVMTIYKVLQEASVFNSTAASVVIAVCVSLLSISGMVRLFKPGNGIYVASDDSVNENVGLDFLLIPYIALGIAIIVVLLLKFIFDKSEKYSSQRLNKEYPQDIEKKHTSDRRAEVWKNTDEESRIRK